METVGFIGLGNMGSGMAGNIQKADYPLVVYDLRHESTRPFVDRGARYAASPAEVARQCEVTFTSCLALPKWRRSPSERRAFWKASGQGRCTSISPPAARP